MIRVREFDPETDRAGAEAVERMCEVGPSGTMSLFTDLLGDPVCRVRHSPAFLMLVAETVDNEIVGLVRGCIKTVTCGKKMSRDGPRSYSPIYTKVAYILGLRVSPFHRRMGIGLKLVTQMEEWFREKGAEYSYMATDIDNEASVRLFTGRCGYSKFRTPSILVHPVYAHRLPTGRHVSIVRLSPAESELVYRRKFATTEFFPSDIDSILRNPLSLGTFLAVRSDSYRWSGVDDFLSDPPESWAVTSVWDSKSVFRLEVKGAGRIRKGLARASRAVDRVLPWFRIPSVPDLFRPFGFYFLYGLGGGGPDAVELVRSLCRHAHNMARSGGCGVVVTELASCDPLREGVPHWKRLSCAEDLWCVRRVADDYSIGEVGDWTKSAPGETIFVDPREF
ncbi:putative N-acetyltransferase HLS1 [Iris pallida]|uniref:N-acetyltransferase HLS1 n=1 Tax=Iris pallida TaxID=29817 RepID=A0AAX6EX33_IRIPA|nr:putative N-acetyltransferase HLS1 [Iris pallida]